MSALEEALFHTFRFVLRWAHEKAIKVNVTPDAVLTVWLVRVVMFAGFSILCNLLLSAYLIAHFGLGFWPCS